MLILLCIIYLYFTVENEKLDGKFTFIKSYLEHVNKMSFFVYNIYIYFKVVKQNWTESSHLHRQFAWNMLIKCHFFVFNMYIFYSCKKKLDGKFTFSKYYGNR